MVENSDNGAHEDLSLAWTYERGGHAALPPRGQREHIEKISATEFRNLMIVAVIFLFLTLFIIFFQGEIRHITEVLGIGQ